MAKIEEMVKMDSLHVYAEMVDKNSAAEEKAAAEKMAAETKAAILSEKLATFALIRMRAEAKAAYKAARRAAKEKAVAEKKAKRDFALALKKVAKAIKAMTVAIKMAASVKTANAPKPLTLAASAAINGTNLAARDEIHAVLQRKEKVSITKISVVDRYASFGRGVELLTQAEKLQYGHDYDLAKIVKDQGRNGLVATVDTLAKAEWLRKVSDEFNDVGNKIVYANTQSGISMVMSKDYYDDILLVDLSASFSAEEHLVLKLARTGVIVRMLFKDECAYRYFFKHVNGFWFDLALYLDDVDPRANGRWNYNHGRCLSNEQIAAMVANGTIVESDNFVFFNASPSATRKYSALFIKVPECVKNIDAWLEEKYSLATNGLTDEMKIDWANGIGFNKAVKDMSRTTLAVTDAREYRNCVSGFCMVNGKFAVKDANDKTGETLVEAFDGAFLASVNVYARMFEAAFGHEPTEEQLKLFHGDCAQMRIACRVKGVAQFFNEDCLTMALGNILSGKLTNSEPCRVLLFHDAEAVKAKKHLVQKGDMIFSGPAYADIKADYAGYIVKRPEKIAELFKLTDVVGDMNAYKYLSVITEAQSVNLMAFPPQYKVNDKVALSNQVINSVIDECFDVLLDIFRQNVVDSFSHKSDAALKLQEFENFDSYADSAIAAINRGAYLLDHYSRYTVMTQATKRANKSINGFNFEVEGFNAVGIIDPGLWLTGQSTIGKQEMVSGNVTGFCVQTAVFRHPRINRDSLMVLNDVNRNLVVGKVRQEAKIGTFSEAEYKAIASVYDGIYGRMAVVPSFNGLFPLTHDGSDYDGDAYLCVTDQRLVEPLKKVDPVAIEYGKAPEVAEKVVFSLRGSSTGLMSPLRAFYQYYSTGNLDIGQMARFNSKIIALLDVLEADKMTSKTYSDLRRMLNFAEGGIESCVFSVDKPEYTPYFALCNNKVLADAEAIDKWVEYCASRSVRNVLSLHALLTDLTIVDSSVMGRIIDAAKTGDSVYAPFVALFKNISCAYGKNHVGVTDIEIKYDAETVVNGEVLVKDKFFVSCYVASGFRYGKNGDPICYVLDDLSCKLKNRCADIFVEEANKYLATLNEERKALADTQTATLLSSKHEIFHGYEGARNIGRIYSGIVSNRRDAMKEVAPYIANSFRLFSVYGGYKERLELALAACQHDPKNTEEGDLVIDYTRGYKTLGAEIAILAVCDKVSDETSLVASGRMHTTRHQVVEDGCELRFINGMAELDNGGFALCEKANGAYKVSFDEDGRAYATADMVEFLKKKSDVASLFAVNFLPVKYSEGQSLEEVNAKLMQCGRSLVRFYNDQEYKNTHVLVSKMVETDKGYLGYLLAVENVTSDLGVCNFEVIAKVAMEKIKATVTINEDGSKRYSDRQMNILDNTWWKVGNVVSYANTKGKLFGAACLIATKPNTKFYISDEDVLNKIDEQL